MEITLLKVYIVDTLSFSHLLFLHLCSADDTIVGMDRWPLDYITLFAKGLRMEI